MARTPFYGRGPGPAIARMDMQAATAPGRAYGQMFANLGKTAGDTIKQYGLNKEKQKKNQAFITGQSNLLGMLEEQDPEQAARYATMKEQLNNPDVSLSERAELGKQLMQNITLTTQLKDQMVNRETKEQALKLANRTEDLTVKNYELGNRQKEIGTLLGQISLDELNAIKDDKTRVALLALKDREKDLLLNDKRRGFEEATIASKTKVLPGATDATIASNETSVMQNEATQQLLPGQTSLAIKKQELDSKNIDAADLLLKAFGGAEGKAEFDYQGAKLSRKNLKLGMKVLSQRGDYYGFLATAKNVPVDTKKQYASIVSDIGKLTDTLVKDPDSGNQITFEKYMEEANDDPDLYPLTGANSGPAGRLYGSFITAQKQADDLLKTTQVQVDDGQDAGGSPAPTRSPINVGNMQPQQAMQALQDRIGQIRKQLPQLNAQEQQLGQPGQMTTTAFDTSPFGNINTPLAVRPQTISDVQNSNIPQQRSDLMAELQQLEAKRQELQSQFGVR